MTTMTHKRIKGLSLGLLVALTGVLTGPEPALGRATGIQIVTFYSATKAAFDAWKSTTSTADPPRTDTFPVGTTSVAFYFHFRNAHPNASHYIIIVRTLAGTTILTIGPRTLLYANGYEMAGAPARRAFAAGRYLVTLVIDGAKVAYATFTVIGPAAINVTIFYPTTREAYAEWGTNGNCTPPARTAVFPAGTKDVAFYARYVGAIPHKMTYNIVIRDHSGAAIGAGTARLFAYTANDLMRDFVRARQFPGGAYHAEFVVDGRVAARTGFMVRG